MTTLAKHQTAAPVSQEEFAGLMSRLGPFEARPEVAVAVSGGADSMAAALLARDWLRSLNGRLVALVVDHGLRPESADEASLVARRLAELEIDAEILPWRGDKPGSNLQAAAREARYGLLSAFCARRGILHLLLGHHRDDQAETFLMRLSRGSGLYGLSAMTALQELPDHRLLRPLLSLPKVRLIATLEARGIRWVEDPSNQDHRFARTGFRELLPGLAAAGVTSETLSETTRRLGVARNAVEVAVAKRLARACWLHPAGIAFVRPERLSSAPRDVALRALSRILVCVSGREYGPRLAPLERLYERLAGGLTSGATLSGCRLRPWRGQIVVYRENRHVAGAVVEAGCRTRWDGRFELFVQPGKAGFRGELTIALLACEGWAEVRRSVEIDRLGFPAFAAEAVPALSDAQGLVAVPHLGYFREGWTRGMVEMCRSRSGISLTGVAFTVA